MRLVAERHSPLGSRVTGSLRTFARSLAGHLSWLCTLPSSPVGSTHVLVVPVRWLGGAKESQTYLLLAVEGGREHERHFIFPDWSCGGVFLPRGFGARSHVFAPQHLSQQVGAFGRFRLGRFCPGYAQLPRWEAGHLKLLPERFSSIPLLHAASRFLKGTSWHGLSTDLVRRRQSVEGQRPGGLVSLQGALQARFRLEQLAEG
eukprot:scaffold300_cov258-Pinguiococcus_pyrenoidosus.AAC.6